MFKIGFSKDCHNLENGNEIILGGIKIPCNKKIIAYSDGDVVFHSLGEAIYGALSLSDIGEIYNSKNMKQNFDSKVILIDALCKLKEKNFKISNIDLLIELDEPKLNNWKEKIKENLLKILKINRDQICLKATTTENNFLNIITCYCNVLIYKEKENI